MRRAAKVLALLVGLLLAIVVGTGIAFYAEPIEFIRWWSRRELEAAGLERARIQATRGPVVYFEGGRGEPVVLVHGLGDQAGTWSRVVSRLVGRYRLLVPDLPGHGESVPWRGSLTFDDEIEGFETFLDTRVRGEEVTLVGNSMGGWLSVLYARDHPGRVRRLVLVDSGGLYEPPEERPLLLPTNRSEARQMVRAILGPHASMPPAFILDDLVETVAEGPGRSLLATVRREHLLDQQLGEIDVPVDLIWGEEDGLLPLSYAHRFERGLPRERLHVLTGCGHIPQVTCPEAFVEQLLAILREPPPPAP